MIEKPEMRVSHRSQNFSRGRKGYRPEAIVIHVTDGGMPGCLLWLCSVSSKVSSHYLISRLGHIYNMVDDANTAWHAGTIWRPSWKLIKEKVNPNSYTIGIEHEGWEHRTWPDVQVEASIKLVSWLCQQHFIPADVDHIVPHWQIRNSKTCPGRYAPLGRLLNGVQMLLKDPEPKEKTDGTEGRVASEGDTREPGEVDSPGGGASRA